MNSTMASEESRGNGRAAKGAKEAAGDDARDVVKLGEVKKSIPELLKLYRKKVDAGAQYKDAIDAVANKSGASKKVLKAYVKARYDDTVQETHAGAEQLSLLFESIGS